MSDTPVKSCTNCGAPVTGPFCQACGQSQKPFERSTLKLLVATAVFLMSWDGKFFHSVGTLLRRPGRYARDWIEGRQARHVHPVRLIFLAALFLVAMSWTDATLLAAKGHAVFEIDSAGNVTEAPCPVQDETCRTLKAAKGNLSIRPFRLIPEDGQKASLQILYQNAPSPDHETREDFEQTDEVFRGLSTLLSRLDKDPHLADALVTKSMRDIFILSAPVLALIYWLCFLGCGRTLAESGVLSITSHIVIILLFAVGLFLTWISRGLISGYPVILILTAIATWHVFGAARTFYGCSLAQGLVRSTCVSLLYCLFLMVMVFAGFIVAIT